MLIQVDHDLEMDGVAQAVGWKHGDDPARLSGAADYATVLVLQDMVREAIARGHVPGVVGHITTIPDGWKEITIDGMRCYLLVDKDLWDCMLRMVVEVPE